MSLAQRTSSRSFTRSTDGNALRLRNTRLTAGVLFLLWLAGCTTLPKSQQAELAAATALPARIELTDTPFFPQRRYQCGPAALATVLVAHGIQVTPDALVGQVYVPDRRGSLPEELSASARRHGLLSYPLAPSLADLLAELAAGHPVLVFQNLGLDWLPRWHFAVVIGYDLDEHTLLLRSGKTRRWRTPMATFLRTWARSDYWARVMVPAGTLPASARALPYLQAAHELEHTAGDAVALPALEAATARWPDQQLAWLALGNNQYAQRHYDRAGEAFLEATRVAPQAAAAWNNLAYALLEQACHEQAWRAVQCATLLDPDPAWEDSAREIRARGVSGDAAGCIRISCPAVPP